MASTRTASDVTENASSRRLPATGSLTQIQHVVRVFRSPAQLLSTGLNIARPAGSNPAPPLSPHGTAPGQQDCSDPAAAERSHATAADLCVKSASGPRSRPILTSHVTKRDHHRRRRRTKNPPICALIPVGWRGAYGAPE